MSILLLLVGIGLTIVNTNGILMVDQWIIYLVFGLSALFFIISLANYMFARREFKKARQRMKTERNMFGTYRR